MAFVETDSYTLQTRVESIVQRGVFSTTSRPTAQQVLDFMALRAAEITSALLLAGVAAAPPTLTNTTLQRTVDLANALLAAGDAIFAHDAKDNETVPRAEALWKEGKDQLCAATEYALNYLSTAGSSIVVGDPATGEPLSFSDMFTTKTEW